MKKSIITMVFLLVALVATAQDTAVFKFASVDYQSLLALLPEYQAIDVDMQELQAKYDADAKLSVDEFNSKYETFLAEQRNYAPSILRKRQIELEDMMKRNETFRNESRRLLEKARKDMEANAKAKLNAIIKDYAQANGYAFVLNSDSDAVPFISPNMAFDITAEIRQILQPQQ